MNKANTYTAHELAKDLELSVQELISHAKKLSISILSSKSKIDEEQKNIIIKRIHKRNQIIKNRTEYNGTQEITNEISNKIKLIFNESKSIDDLVSLINTINKYHYGDKSKNIKKQTLTYYAYHNKEKYTIFPIAKKSGGTREIYSPERGLKNILKTLNIIFQSVHKSSFSSHGFTQNRSVVTNAKVHVNKNYVYNIDLENFFPSIHQARIWKRLQYPPFNLNGDRLELSNLISNLVCFQYPRIEQAAYDKKVNFLPQGAPTSPVLSNIICHRLDKKLFKLAKEYNLKYTRYADDITFSSNHNVYQEDSEFLSKLRNIVKEESFSINPKKIRLQKRGYRQEVTGIIVNEKVNVNRKYIKNIRQLIHLIDKYGIKKANLIFAKHYKKDHPKTKNIPSLELVINGKLQYLKMVKGFDDTTYVSLVKKFNNSYKNINLHQMQKISSVSSNNLLNDKEDIHKHNPKKMGELLHKFTSEEPLKSATHVTLYNRDYEDYIEKLQQAYSNLSKTKEYESFIKPELQKKITAFLTIDEYTSGWGVDKIKFGWRSKELKEWAIKNLEENPLEYKLKNCEDSNIKSFKDVVNKFKSEIEFRPDGNNLYDLMFKVLDERELDIECDENSSYNLVNAKFFMDTQWFKEGLDIIVREILQWNKNSEKVKIVCDKEDDSYIIKIIHIDSSSSMNVDEMLERISIEYGSFPEIKQKFNSICDFSIEFLYNEEPFGINLLSIDTQEIQQYKPDYSLEGFTYILKVYWKYV